MAAGRPRLTHTYVASNPAADDLAPIPPTTRADLVTDDSCEPVEFVDGDPEDDEILSEGEAWTYECTTVITELTVNTATGPMGSPAWTDHSGRHGNRRPAACGDKHREDPERRPGAAGTPTSPTPTRSPTPNWHHWPMSQMA